MLRHRVGVGVFAALLAAGLSSCGSPAPQPTAKRTPPPPRAARPSAAAGPCASVTTTTAIADVPAACAALWAPYGVTKVPPANLTDATPGPPAEVINASGGSLSGSRLDDDQRVKSGVGLVPLGRGTIKAIS